MSTRLRVPVGGEELESPGRARRVGVVWWLAGIGAGVAVAVGVALRAWLVFHRPLNSDEAIVGLMAAQIRHGHLYTFYWGQSYGGVEPYVAAVAGWLAGSDTAGVTLTPLSLSVVAAGLVALITTRLALANRWSLALLAGAAMFVWPEAAVWNSTVEWGFRGAVLVAGLAAVYFACRAAQRWSPVNLGLTGVFAGLGWWASPELVYFALPVGGIVLFGATWPGERRPWARLAALPAGFVVGAAPWLWTNLRTGFVSLSTSSSPTYVKATYIGRLSIFFHQTLPMMLGLRLPVSGTWVPSRVGPVLYWVALAVIAFLCVRALLWLRTDATWRLTAWIAVGVLAFPLLIAVFPATSYWNDGQYGTYIDPLLILLAVGNLAHWARGHTRRGAPPSRLVTAKAAFAAVAVVVLVAAADSAVAFDRAWLRPAHASFSAGWHDPNAAAQTAASALERQGVVYGYAQYWVAYDLDLLSGGRLRLSDVESDRWAQLHRQVADQPSQAWVFYSPSQVAEASAIFDSSAAGIGGETEAVFLSQLDAIHVGYKVIHDGPLDAVIPQQPVSQEHVGMPPPYWP